MEESSRNEIKTNIDGDKLSEIVDPAVLSGDMEHNSSSSLKDLLEYAPLLITIERQIVSILLAHGLVKVLSNTDSTDDYSFDNIELTGKGQAYSLDHEDSRELAGLISTLTTINNKVLLKKSTNFNLSDEDVERYRKVFPVGSRGTGVKIVKHRLEKFMSENDCTFEEIIKAAKMYVQYNTSKGYNIMGAHFFLYKRDPQSKVDESKAEEFLDQVRQGHVDNDWRNQVT